MIGVVIDTNVVVSAFLNDEGAESRAVDLALAGEVRLFTSTAILREYEETLSRPKFAIRPERIQGLMSALRAVASWCSQLCGGRFLSMNRITAFWSAPKQPARIF